MAEARGKFRPGFLAVVGGHLWVVDRMQPTAEVIDLGSGAVVASPSWPEVLPSTDPDPFDPDGDWRVLAGDRCLWVQQRNGPVAQVSERGFVTGHYARGLALTTRSAHGVWCLPPPPKPDLAAHQDAPPPMRPPYTSLQLLGAAGAREIRLNAAGVRGAASYRGDLYLHLEMHTGGSRTPLIRGRSWLYAPPLQWMRLRRDQPVPDLLGQDVLEPCAGPVVPSSARNGGHLRVTVRRGSSQVRHSEPAGGRAWSVGHDPAATKDPPRALAWPTTPTNADPGTPIDLGPGAPVAALGTDQHLWVAVEEPNQHDSHSRPAPTSLLRVDVATGTVSTVLSAGSIDITHRSWPLGPRPIDVDEYVTYWQQLFHQMVTSPTPLADGFSAGRAEAVGSWPDTALHVTFELDSHPGRRLRRTVHLYDELGRPTPPDGTLTHLWEQIETRSLPSPR